MRKPKFINRPENVTLKGLPRKSHRTFSEKEIEYLKQQQYIE